MDYREELIASIHALREDVFAMTMATESQARQQDEHHASLRRIGYALVGVLAANVVASVVDTVLYHRT